MAKTKIAGKSEKTLKLESQLKDLMKGMQWMQSGMLALLREVDKLPNAHEIVQNATKNGGINITQFWSEHSERQEAKVAAVLNNYTDQEKELMLKLLTPKKKSKLIV